jgi:hypothetical protein
MSEIPAWHLTGEWFDVCSCDIPCPCEFAQPPTNNVCEGVLAWHIRDGDFGEVRLDGLNVVGLGWIEGNIWSRKAKVAMGLYLDDRADDAQREALATIFGGQAGGWPAGFAAMLDEVRGIEYAPIEFEIDDELASWRVEVPGKARGSAEALSGPTSPEGARVQLHNAPGAEVGPGQVATWATATEDEVEAFAFQWSWPGRSSKHFPFDWSGPDEA